MLEGILAGLIADGSLYSLEAIKSRQQSCTRPTSQSLYFGVGTGLVGSALTGFLYFGAYESLLAHPSFSLPLETRHFVAGGLADLACSIVSVPTDTLKSRLQVYGRSRYLGGWHALRTIVQVEGVASLYRSFWCTVLRDVPYSAIQFGVAEVVSRQLVGQLGSVGAFLSGIVAGALAGAATNPMDVVKTQRQLGVMEVGKGGFSWMVLGVVPRTVACGLYSGLLLGVYSLAKGH